MSCKVLSLGHAWAMATVLVTECDLGVMLRFGLLPVWLLVLLPVWPYLGPCFGFLVLWLLGFWIVILWLYWLVAVLLSEHAVLSRRGPET